jgi:hypothetical protein
MIWTNDSITTYLDTEDNVILNSTMKENVWLRERWNETDLFNPWKGAGPNAPFDQKFYLLINLAIGGTGLLDLSNSLHLIDLKCIV